MARTIRFRRPPSPFTSLDNATTTTTKHRQLLARRIGLLASLALTIFWSSTLFLSMHLPSPSLPMMTMMTTTRQRMGMGRADFWRASSRVVDDDEVSPRSHPNGSLPLPHHGEGQFPKSDSTIRPVKRSQSLSIQQPRSPSRPRDPRLVHVLETRFMQNQPDLIQLARARLRLFRTVCLPSVRRQTAWGDFLWIIRTDPALDPAIRTELMEMLDASGSLVYETTKKEYEKEEEEEQTKRSDNDNDKHGVGITYLVGSNDNYISANATLSNVRPFDVRHMLSALTSHPSSVLAGKLSSLEELLDELTAVTAAPSHPPNNVVLWTRLDADDGLHVRYLEHLQSQAVRYFLPDYYSSFGSRRVLRNESPYRPPRWTYWCAGTNVDWFLDARRSRGAVYPVEHTNVCVTPGVTVALADGVDPGTVPRLDHDVIVSYLRGKKEEGEGDEDEGEANEATRRKDRGSMCGREGRSVVERMGTNEKKEEDDDDDKDDDWTDDEAEEEGEPDDGTCFHMIRSFPFAAVRSRTPTSAGMLGISPTLTQLEIVRRHPGVQTFMWKVLEREFRIEDEELVETNEYFGEMVFEIAEENAKGQCTEGHSCKTSSKDLLQQYVDLKKEMTGGFDTGRHGMIVDRHTVRMGYAQEEER